ALLHEEVTNLVLNLCQGHADLFGVSLVKARYIFVAGWRNLQQLVSYFGRSNIALFGLTGDMHAKGCLLQNAHLLDVGVNVEFMQLACQRRRQLLGAKALSLVGEQEVLGRGGLFRGIDLNDGSGEGGADDKTEKQLDQDISFVLRFGHGES